MLLISLIGLSFGGPGASCGGACDTTSECDAGCECQRTAAGQVCAVPPNATLHACPYGDPCGQYTTASACAAPHVGNLSCAWAELATGESRCMPPPQTCCLPMGDACPSPDTTRWPCCCPGKELLPGPSGGKDGPVPEKASVVHV